MNLNTLFHLLKGAAVTLQISFLGVLIGLFCGVIMGFLSCKNVKAKGIKVIIKAYVALFRGTPLFVQLLLVYFAIPEITPFSFTPLEAGVIALGLNSAAYVSEIIRGGMNALPISQWEACYCLGYSKPQTLVYIILPQTIKNVFPAMTNELIALIKDSSILMLLGVKELTKVSKDIVARELCPFEIYLLTALVYFFLTTSVSFFSKRVEEALP